MKRVSVTAGPASRFTIWDNFARIKQQLEALGATASQVEELRLLAQAVEEAERKDGDATDVEIITQPRTCANGWVIKPPTKQALYFARLCADEATGGAIPSTSAGQALAVIAGLWALKRCSEGDLRGVASTLAKSGALQAVAADLLAEHEDEIDELADDYMVLMGFPQPGANSLVALRAFLSKRSEILRACVAAFQGSPTASPS